MASCDTTVLTGQEGLIQFKPLGTTNCVDDYCPWVGDRVYLSCAAEYTVGDCLEVDVDNIPTDEGQSTDGTSGTVIKDGDTYYVVDTGKGAVGDEDSCGNSMEGVPYIKLSTSVDGAPITWDNSIAGEELAAATLNTTNGLNVSNSGDGYTDGTYKNVPLVGGTGTGGTATVVIGTPTTGKVGSVTVTPANGDKVGTGYTVGDTLTLNLPAAAGTPSTAAEVTLVADDIVDVRGDSDKGNYTFRLCDFQTVCGVRSFSIDLSRDELDVTTLPCSTSEACGKELASFRKTQAGFATATGTLEVYFSCDQESTANKLLTGSLQKTQGGATVRLYVCTKTNADGTINETDSLYIEADVQLLGLSFSVDPDNPTTATINFGVTEVRSAFGLTGG